MLIKCIYWWYFTKLYVRYSFGSVRNQSVNNDILKKKNNIATIWTNISPLLVKMTLDCCQNRSLFIVDLKSK